MLELFYKIFTSTPMKIIQRFIAGLASAIIVINGFLFFINVGQQKEKDSVGVELYKREEESNDESNETSPQSQKVE